MEDELSQLAYACEYYEDAYVGTDAPFEQPSGDLLCHLLQKMSRLVLTHYHKCKMFRTHLENGLKDVGIEIFVTENGEYDGLDLSGMNSKTYVGQSDHEERR